MSDVFISYSRRDIDFVHYLFDQLKNRGLEPWADWQDIPPTADWLNEIYRGIEAASSFLFVITPDSVQSEICSLEIDHAVKHNKRLIPVVRIKADNVHQELSSHNWIFLQEEDEFDDNFGILIQALNTDLDYVKEHARLLVRAIEWDQSRRSAAFVLNRQELKKAKSFLLEGRNKDPQPAQIHHDYIDFSHTQFAKKAKLIMVGITGVSAFLFLISYLDYRINHQKLKDLVSFAATITADNVSAAVEFDMVEDARETLSTLAREEQILGALVYKKIGSKLTLFSPWTNKNSSFKFPDHFKPPEMHGNLSIPEFVSKILKTENQITSEFAEFDSNYLFLFASKEKINRRWTIVNLILLVSYLVSMLIIVFSFYLKITLKIGFK